MLGFLNLISRHSGESRKPYGSNTSTIFKNHVKQTTLWIPAFARMTKRDNSKSPSGNAVVLILIAVALFGALSYTFMRGSKSGQGNLTSNQARIAAQEIIDYAQSIERGVNKLRQRGCSESEFDIQNTVWLRVDAAPAYSSTDNPGARPDGTCALFLPTGANLKAQTIALNHTDIKGQILTATSFAPGSYIIGLLDIPWANGGTTQTEIVFHAPFLTDQVCMKINDILGVANNGNAPPSGTDVGGTRYRSPNMSASLTIIDASGQITGKTAFCVQSSSGSYWNRFIYTLLVR